MNRFSFTQANLAALPVPESARSTYSDTTVPGLQLRITPTGVKTFSVLKRARTGRLERITLGRFPAVDVKRARHEASALLADMAAGINAAEARRKLRGEPTFAELFTRYLDEHAKPHKKSWREDERQYARHLAAALGTRRLSTIDGDTLRTLHRKISRTAPASANQALALVSSVFTRAIEWKLVKENPAHGIRRNARVERDRFLGADELRRFFVAIESEENADYRELFTLALLTGARRSNVLAMRWSDLDLQRGEWRLGTTKNGQPQLIALAPAAVAVLSERPHTPRSPFVFASAQSATGHLASVARAWRRVLDRDELVQLVERIGETGEAFGSEATALRVRLRHTREAAERLDVDTAGARLEDLRLHDLRRTNASWQAMLGSSLAIVGRSLGHRSARTTEIYARLQLDPVRASVERAATAMLATTGEPGAVIGLVKAR
jgi:integrase